MNTYARAAFYAMLESARPADLDRLRLDIGFSRGGRRPALLLRGSTWGTLTQLLVCAAARGTPTTADGVARMKARRADEFGPWLAAWQHKERGRRYKLAEAAAVADAVRGPR